LVSRPIFPSPPQKQLDVALEMPGVALTRNEH
jgi:hypothetical protein